MGEIEEEAAPANADESSPLLSDPNSPHRIRSVRTKVPEVEVHFYELGKGPIDVFKSSLSGWDQDQLEVRDILDKYGFKSLYAFTPASGCGAAIRFNPEMADLWSYKDGSVIYLDGLFGQTSYENSVRGCIYNRFDSICYQGGPARLGHEVEPFRWSYSPMDPCLRGYCVHPHEKEN